MQNVMQALYLTRNARGLPASVRRYRELAERVGITPANLSILKNNKAKAIRFSTLMALCHELSCQPGDLLEFVDDETAPEAQ